MGLLDGLGNNPQISELVGLLGALDVRVAALEEYVLRNDTRITSLERRYDNVIVVAGQRIGQLEEEIAGATRTLDRQRRRTDQLRWLTTRRRR